MADKGAVKERDFSPRASWIEGRDFRSGESFSSLIDRRVVDSGGEI